MNRRGFIAWLVAAPVAKALPWAAIASTIGYLSPVVAEEITLSLTEIVERTLRARMPDLVANISANNALLQRIMDKR